MCSVIKNIGFIDPFKWLCSILKWLIIWYNIQLFKRDHFFLLKYFCYSICLISSSVKIVLTVVSLASLWALGVTVLASSIKILKFDHHPFSGLVSGLATKLF